jgi:hypothetical protein
LGDNIVAIKRRDTRDGARFDVEWRLPDRTKRRKTFKSEREARVFEASIVTKSATGDVIDPGAGRVTLTTVYRSLAGVPRRSESESASRLRRRLAIAHRALVRQLACVENRPPIDPVVGQRAGLIWTEPAHGAWVHSALKITLDYAVEDGQLLSRNPASRTKVSSAAAEVAHLPDDVGGRGAGRSVWPPGRCCLAARISGLRFGEVVWTDGRRRRPLRPENPRSALDHASRRKARRGKSEERRWPPIDSSSRASDADSD